MLLRTTQPWIVRFYPVRAVTCHCTMYVFQVSSPIPGSVTLYRVVWLSSSGSLTSVRGSNNYSQSHKLLRMVELLLSRFVWQRKIKIDNFLKFNRYRSCTIWKQTLSAENSCYIYHSHEILRTKGFHHVISRMFDHLKCTAILVWTLLKMLSTLNSLGFERTTCGCAFSFENEWLWLKKYPCKAPGDQIH
jgi:hypothetical protein